MARRPIRRGGQKPQLTWIGNDDTQIVSFQAVAGSAGEAGSASYLTQSTAFDTDRVLQRLHGTLSVQPTSISLDPDETFLLYYGAGIASLEALAGAALPAPAENSTWDGWFLHGAVIVRGNVVSTLQVDGNTGFRMLDSKAKRRIPQGSGVFVGVQARSLNVTSTGSLSAMIQIRFLLKTN